MSLVVITGGLDSEQLSFIEEAMSQSFGSGAVALESYELSDITLVKELRLRVSDPSVVLVVLSSFSSVPTLERSRGILEESGKLFEVKSTQYLVDYLNSSYSLDLEYSQEDNLGDVTENEKFSDFDTSYYDRLLSAKDDTIKSLELQLEEQKVSYEGILKGISEDNYTLSSFSSSDSLKLEEFESTIEILSSKLSSLEEENSRLRSEKANISSKFASADSLSRSQSLVIDELKEKLSSQKEETVDISSYLAEIESLRSVIAEKDTSLASLDSKLSRKEKEFDVLSKDVSRYLSTISSYEDSNKQLKIELEEERRNVVNLNRQLLSQRESTSLSENSDNILDLPDSLTQPVWGSLWGSKPKFKNIRFLFAGSGDSHREAYLYAEQQLSSSSSGGIFFDLSTESVADYRFGVKRLKNVNDWYNSREDSLKQYLSKTKYQNVFVLGTSGGSFNELSYLTLDLYQRLSYLDSLNVSVIVYGGDIGSYFSRSLMSSAFTVSGVEVVCRGLGTSARSMYFNSKMVSGSLNGQYSLMGRVDDICKKVMRVAKKEGFDWRILDA